MKAIELIQQERNRQMAIEGWTPDHDAQHENDELAIAAACYAASEPIFVRRQEESHWSSGSTGDRGDRQLRLAGYYDAWPWDAEWDKREKHDRLRQLVIAGALIVAEIERLTAKEPADEQR